MQGMLAAAVLLAANLPAQLLGVQPEITLPGAFAPLDLAAGDMDGNGTLDLVVHDIATIRVLPGDGHGGFGPAIVIPLQFPPFLFSTTLLLADSNGDGRLDIWVSHAFGCTMLLNDGAGGFVVGPNVPGDGRAANGDLNADGHPDLARSVSVDTVGVAFHDGHGGFGPLTIVASGFVFAKVVGIGNVDRDGHADILLTFSLGSQFVVLFGDGTGSFSAGTAVVMGGPMLDWTFADIDGDRLVDVVTVDASSNLLICRNQGDRSFGPPLAAAGTTARALAIADITGDGQPDVVGIGPDAATVLPGDGQGGLGPAASFSMAPRQRYFPLALGDFDADGRIDVAAGRFDEATQSASLVVLRNLLPTPAGVVAFGIGTPTCGGTIGIWATAPTLGSRDFMILNSNAPPDAAGLLMFGHGRSSGWEPFGLGIQMHIDLPWAVLPLRSDVAGVASRSFWIPRIPWLAGARFAAQTLWAGDAGLGNTCSPGRFELATSRGLGITLQR